MLDLPGSFILPDAPRTGIVINVPEYRMYYYRAGDSAVLSFPIGVGRAGFQTPIISSSVVAKLEKPAWYPPRSIREEHRVERNEILPAMVPPGPDNPLGEYAMLLDSDGYLIHGTNKKIGIGMQVSHGCIRLYNQDIERLIGITPIGLSVKIVSQPVKAAVSGAQIWIEIHPDSSHDLAETSREVSLAVAKAKSSIDSEHYASMDASKIRAEVLNPSGRVVQVGVVVKKSDLVDE
jgi:L,D-transpeptidase ErfK/SrfK